tara:strand:+ start:17921 stop:18085 length:165 start_codon:yes stop_codon:yes gene_type:complete
LSAIEPKKLIQKRTSRILLISTVCLFLIALGCQNPNKKEKPSEKEKESIIVGVN